MKREVILLVFIFLSISFASSCNEGQININSASLVDLDKLTGIGPAYAQKIVDSRPYSTLDDLLKVNGIGPATLSKIKTQGLACVESSSTELNNPITESQNEPETAIGYDNNTQSASSRVSTQTLSSASERTAIQSQSERLANQSLVPTESIINLNSEESIQQKVVYESKNESIRKYLIYVFALFLLIIIFILLIKR